MAWVTAIGPDIAQIEYRLEGNAGCSLGVADDAQVAYRLDSDRPLEWVGAGLREVGIAPGSVLDEAGKTAARALADGLDPRDGSVLVAPKLAVDPRAKLPAAPLAAAVAAAAERAATTPAELLGDIRIAARYARLLRGLARERDAHKVPVAELDRIAAAAGVDLADVYAPEDLALARKHAAARVRVGNRGYDLTLDLPKSYSVLVGLAPAGLARHLEDAYLDAVRETVTAMEGWAGYGMRGHHGNGHRATRVQGTGLLGWMTVHRTARPVAGAPPDPHLHAHLTLLNMVRGDDGQWSAVGAGGRDIHRHAHAADAYVKARLRQVTAQRFGIVWERDARTGEWEVAAVPAGLRRVFSKRSDQVETTLRELGFDVTKATTRQSKLAAWQSRQAKHRAGTTARGGDLRDAWRAQAHAAGVDPTHLVAAATPGPGGPPAASPSPEDVARRVFRPEHGLTAHGKVTTRADVLAAVIDALPAGLTRLAEAEQLVDQVLALDHLVVALPPAGAAHLTNHQRYTTTDILAAEHTVLDAARAGYGTGAAVVDAPVLALAMAEFEAANGFALTAEQRAVLVRLARGGHAVDTVVGVAGSGKTTIMAALRVAYEAAGLTVAGAATAAVAVQNLQTEAGITSQTIASWLACIRTGEGLAGVGVLVVDEAAMVDDRHLAQLLSAARAAGTKVVGIGDPLQLRAVGVGGTFAAVHQMIGGGWLTENRRQRDVDERAALALWRADERRAALHRWADAGRIHVTDAAAAAHAAMLTVWDHERQQWADPHERIGQLLMLAHTNADVDALNTAAQALRAAAGELSRPRYAYRLDDGRRVELGAGDAVLLRVNDRRTRRGGTDVLNGFRGIVTAIDGTGRVQVEWRQPGEDGPALVREWVTPAYIAGGGLSLGYAITAAKAQGLTAARALVYGGGMDAHVLYPAMSRDRWRADLWLAQNLIEDPTDAVRHGPAATEAEALARTVAAYAAALERDLPDRLVLTELGRHPDPITPP
ncbi:MAG TPA: MobF family relaxase, partial [Rugosimonospora sp.]|nr:MobF family relaxase [Rugosimonospora sp.]